jgi:DUF4097 and DUF4098 domain-containing protein YvlB
MRPAAFRFLPAVVGLCFASLLASPAHAGPSNTFDRTVPLNPSGTFELQNVNGSVEVSSWDRHEVEIHAVKTANRRPSDLERVTIEVHAVPDAVSVTTRYPHDEGVEVVVQYRIRIPQDCMLSRVSSVNGGLRISGVPNARELRSVNGNVEILDSSGQIKAHTTNGNIRVELRHFNDSHSLSAETVNGSVLVALPPDAGGALDVLTMNGDFRSELPVTLQGSFSPRGFYGTLGRGGSPVRVRSVNGGIRVVAMRPSV